MQLLNERPVYKGEEPRQSLYSKISLLSTKIIIIFFFDVKRACKNKKFLYILLNFMIRLVPVSPPPAQGVSSSARPAGEDAPLTISEITRNVQRALEAEFGDVRVRGEISNYVHHSSGHRYFTLKDSSSQLKAVLWRSVPLAFTPTNGMSVVARGKITMYPPQGALQIECRSLAAAGEGDLQMAFEALKRELYARGWFDAARKRPLPAYPMRIGVATSPTGAAIRDILSTLARRMPAAEVVFRPTLVQGANAAEDIARAIADLNRAECDALIVGRGGGSIEDLWAFNTEIVARAILESAAPVVSAVGHEIDVTIADFVADRRAATPTAAAEILTRDAQEILAALAGAENAMRRALERVLENIRRRVEFLAAQSALARFPDELRRRRQRLDDVETRLHSALPRTLRHAAERLSALTRHLDSLRPLAPLERGFALVEENGRTLRADEPLREGARIVLIRARECAEVTVQSVEPSSRSATR